MTTASNGVYWGAHVDPSGDDYIVGKEAMYCKITQKVNTPSVFELEVSNKDAGKINTYTNDDVIEFHVGTEPLYQWDSLSAVKFNGSTDFIQVSHDSSIDFGSATDFTVAFRVKADAFGSGIYELVSKSDGGSPEWRIYLKNDGAFEAYLDDGVNNATVTSATGFDDGLRHDCIISFDRDGNAQWYIDGSTSGSAVDISSVGDIDDGQDLYIGSYADAGNYANLKILDDLAIWSEVISGSDRTDYFNYTVDTTNLELYHKYDTGYDTSATDSSTNTNTGTLDSSDMWVNPKIFTGYIQEIDIIREAYKHNRMIMRGEDKLTILGERLARGTFSTATSAGQVLKDLITQFASGEYTTVNVDTTGTTITNFTTGAETSILALMRRLAELPGESYDFYIDGGGDIHFHPRADASWNTGVTLRGNQIRRMTVTKSTKDKKTFIKVTGTQEPFEESSNRQNTVTDSVSMHSKYYADDFIAEHDNLMQIDLYLQKIGNPSGDLTGRIALAKYDGPSGDFLEFTILEEDVSTTAGWVSVRTPLPTQVGTRYFIRLDKIGDVSNTYKWYGDTPAVADAERKAKQSDDGILWSELDYDLSMRVYYGIYSEATAEDPATPKREAIVPLPSNTGIDNTLGEEIASQVLANYLQTAYKATLLIDATEETLTPSYLITLDEADDGLSSKTYRIEKVSMEFGAQRKCTTFNLDISATLPYMTLDEDYNRVKEALLGGATSSLESGAEESITTAKVGLGKVGKSYFGVFVDEE